jgi:hypothetical protein
LLHDLCTHGTRINKEDSPLLTWANPLPATHREEKNYERGRKVTTLKKNQIFLLYKEIQKGSVAKSYMTVTASSYIWLSITKPFIYDSETNPI